MSTDCRRAFFVLTLPVQPGLRWCWRSHDSDKLLAPPGAVLLLTRATSAPLLATQCQPTASGCTFSCKAAQLANLSSLGGCGVTLTATSSVSGTAPATYGVNAGHAYPWSGSYADGSWIAFMQRLGGEPRCAALR